MLLLTSCKNLIKFERNKSTFLFLFIMALTSSWKVGDVAAEICVMTRHWWQLKSEVLASCYFVGCVRIDSSSTNHVHDLLELLIRFRVRLLNQECNLKANQPTSLTVFENNASHIYDFLLMTSLWWL